MSPEYILAGGIQQLGLVVEAEQQQKMMKYLGLLQKWNRVYNLTAIDKTELMVSHHLLDSLAVLPHLMAGRWLDVGSGAGLPGLVLALMRPDWEFELLDSNSKKCSFVQQAAIELNIKNIQVTCARVQDWKKEKKFDGIISRAFAELEKFVVLTHHLLMPGGVWVAMKGMPPNQELQQLPAGIVLKRIISLQVPGVDGERCLVILEEI